MARRIARPRQLSTAMGHGLRTLAGVPGMTRTPRPNTVDALARRGLVTVSPGRAVITVTPYGRSLIMANGHIARVAVPLTPPVMPYKPALIVPPSAIVRDVPSVRKAVAASESVAKGVVTLPLVSSVPNAVTTGTVAFKDVQEVVNVWTLPESRYVRTLDKLTKIMERAESKGLKGGYTWRVLDTWEVPTWEDPNLSPDLKEFAFPAHRWPSRNWRVIEDERGEIIERVNKRTGESVFPFGWTTWRDLEVTGHAPQFGDWVFAATLVYDQSGVFTVRTMPGYAGGVIARDMVREDWCDECGTSRDRKVTYLCENVTTGQRRQVGSSCIKDFIGHPAAYAELTWLESGFVPAPPSERPEPVYQRAGELGTLAVAACLRWGAVSRKGADAYENAARENMSEDDFWEKFRPLVTTSDRVSMHLSPPMPGTKNYAKNLARWQAEAEIHATDDDRAMCETVMEWIMTDAALGKDGLTQWVSNLREMVTGGFISPANRATWISLFVVYVGKIIREREDAIKRESQAKSEYVGAIKERLTFKDLEIVDVMMREEQAYAYPYGPETRGKYTFKDAQDNLITWWTTERVALDSDGCFTGGSPMWKVGDLVSFKATVKKHETFRDVKSTVVTNCRSVVHTAV